MCRTQPRWESSTIPMVREHSLVRNVCEKIGNISPPVVIFTVVHEAQNHHSGLFRRKCPSTSGNGCTSQTSCPTVGDITKLFPCTALPLERPYPVCGASSASLFAAKIDETDLELSIHPLDCRVRLQLPISILACVDQGLRPCIALFITPMNNCAQQRSN